MRMLVALLVCAGLTLAVAGCPCGVAPLPDGSTDAGADATGEVGITH